MIVRAERHVFGTSRGYRTLAASGDLRPEEIQELEVLSFGQTSDTGYLDSLEATPAYWSRMLNSGKRAITRVFRGLPDDKGRPTLLLVTIVLAADDWVRVLSGGEHVLLADRRLWAWDGRSEVSPVELRMDPPAPLLPTAAERKTLLCLLGMIEEYIGERSITITLTEGEVSLRTIQVLPSLLPPEVRRSFSYAVRTLSDGLPVVLNLLAPSASRGKSRRRIVSGAQSRDYRRREFTNALAHFWAEGAPPPWKFVANCRRFGRLYLVHADVSIPVGGAGMGSATMAGVGATPRRERRGRVRLVVRILALVIGLAVVAAAVAIRWAAINEQQGLAQEVESFLERNPIGVCAASDECQDRAPLHQAENLKQRLGAYETLPPSLQRPKEQLDAWMGEAEWRRAQYDNLKRDVDAFDEPFARELGVDVPLDRMQLPGKHATEQVASWTETLTKVQNEAASVATPLANRAHDRLQKLSNWEGYVERRYTHYKGELDDIDKLLGSRQPWSDVTIEKIEAHRGVIGELSHLLEAAASDDDQRRRELRQQFCDVGAKWAWRATRDQLARARVGIAQWCEAQCPRVPYLCGVCSAVWEGAQPLGAAQD